MTELEIHFNVIALVALPRSVKPMCKFGRHSVHGIRSYFISILFAKFYLMTSVDIQVKTNAVFVQKWFPLKRWLALGLVCDLLSLSIYLFASAPSFLRSFSLAFSTKDTLALTSVKI